MSVALALAQRTLQRPQHTDPLLAPELPAQRLSRAGLSTGCGRQVAENVVKRTYQVRALHCTNGRTGEDVRNASAIPVRTVPPATERSQTPVKGTSWP